MEKRLPDNRLNVLFETGSQDTAIIAEALNSIQARILVSTTTISPISFYESLIRYHFGVHASWNRSESADSRRVRRAISGHARRK
jgi:hypothetical protein